VKYPEEQSAVAEKATHFARLVPHPEKTSMTLPRQNLRSRSRCLSARARLAQAIETLESRRLMCSLHDNDLEQALVDDYLRNKNAAATDHNAAWYEPVDTTRTGHSAAGDVVPAGTTFSVNAAGLPLLTSRADGQGLKVFLDFDGYGTDTPFSTDADGSTFNASEQVSIYDTWRDIVSFFAPLDVNITTVQPATGGNNPAFIWHRISNSISGGAAYVGWFTNDRSNSWTGQDGGTTRHSGIAHEVGHQLGLSHQAEWDISGNKSNEYSDGFSNRDRPIMGIDFAQNVRSWFYGRNSNGTINMQDDLNIMTSIVGGQIDGYRPDDFAATLGGASLVPASGMVGGIIERIDDADTFRLVSTGGTYQIAATPTFESSVSPKIELLDVNGNIIAARDDADRRNTNNNAQEFSLNLDAGTYYVRVSGGGDYAEQGEYLLTAAPLPTDWTSQDIGAATIYRAGTAAYDPISNTLKQIGGGTDIWSNSDEFRFTSTTLTGDGSITARIDSLDNVDFNAKAGVMIRSTTAANSAHVYVGIKPSGQLDPIVRTSAGATAATVGNPSGATGPWVRLTRAGNLFTIERSSNGVAWSVYGTTTVVMESAVQIGFATNSRSARQQAYASFSGVAVTGALGMAAPTYNGLAAPTNLSAAATVIPSTSILLQWSAVAGAAGYAIERSVDGVTYTLLSSVGPTVTTSTDSNPYGAMRYFYRLSTIATDGTRSAPSTSVSVVNKPGAVTNPAASYAQPVIRYSSTQLLLNWTDVQGDNGYFIERSTAGGAYVHVKTTARNQNAYNDSNLAPNTAYTYRVRPLTTVGISPSATAPWTISAITPLAAAANFRVSARTATSLTLSWTDMTGESAYRVERSTDNVNWTTVGDSAVNSTAITDTNRAPLTRYYYRLRGINSVGQLGDASTAFAATPAATALPANWSNADVGNVPGAGAAAGTVGGTWTLIAAGNDIWNQADQFHYASRAVTGDGSIVARLTALEDTDFYTKAGVMFRASTAANAPYVFMHYSIGPGLQFEYRDSTGAASGNSFILASTARWLKLARIGNVFTASYSADGSTWTTAAARTVAMSSTATMGLAATSHNVDRLTLATFDNVATTGTGTNAAPIITAAAANPTTVIASTTTLSVAATDDGGAANLSYLWSVIAKPADVADPIFSINNTNSASTTTATFFAAGNYTFRVTVADAQGLTATHNVTAAVTLRTTGTFEFDKPQPQFSVLFNGDVGASLSASDLVLTNLTTGAVIPASQIVSSFVTASGTAVFTFTTGPNGTLPDGNYQAKLLAGSVAEASGVALAADATFSFFVKAGDANRDGTVDFADLVILSQNYNQVGKTFSAGNFDYDPEGRVDFADLVILSQNYNTTLAPIAAVIAPTKKPTKAMRGGAAAII
jgi:regulation of enolase protein 1 (concanavalin A-like superfamily)